MLTRDDIQRLRAPLPLNDHEVKIKVLPRDGKKSMWLVYIDQTGIIPLLQDIDPNYSWMVVDKQRVDERLCVVTGRLIIGGASYDGVGGSTPNYDDDPYSEDTEKAAETDAFKRAAVKCGVGLYLRNAPQIWVDGNLGKGYEARDAAWKQFDAWYSKTYGIPHKGATTAKNGDFSHVATTSTAAPQNTAKNADEDTADYEAQALNWFASNGVSIVEVMRRLNIKKGALPPAHDKDGWKKILSSYKALVEAANS